MTCGIDAGSSMKPGITGLWQVRARQETVFDKWVQDDLEYIDRWSLWLDLQILVRTIPAALEGHGADDPCSLGGTLRSGNVVACDWCLETDDLNGWLPASRD